MLALPPTKQLNRLCTATNTCGLVGDEKLPVTGTTISPDSDEPRNRHERRASAAGHVPAAWRVNGWLEEVPISRSKFYEERNAGRIKTVKVGSSTLVTTAPKDYLAALAA
jgi:hypothetical protein